MSGPYQIDFFKEDDGSSPVELWLESLKIKDQAVLADAIKSLKILGPDFINNIAAKRFNESYFEIKKGRNRILFLRDGNKFLLLHGFPKYQKTTPLKDVNIGDNRYKKYYDRKKNG